MKELLLSICSAILGLFVFLLIDLVLSASILINPDARKPYLRFDSGWYELKKDFMGVDQWGEKIYPVKTDSLGFRSDDLKINNELAKVIFLGDSFTYGINGAWSETFVGMFARYSNVNVLNGGVPSYSPTPYLVQYQKATVSNRLATPHTVILGIDPSDVQDEATRWREGSDHPVDISPAQSISGFRNFLSRRLYLTKQIYRFVQASNTKTATMQQVFDTPQTAFLWKDWLGINDNFSPLGVEGGIKQIEKVVEKIALHAHRSEGELFLLVYPHPANLAHENRNFDWEQYIEGLCKKFVCSGVINTLPRFRSIQRAEPDWYTKYFVDGDVHFTEAGNKIVFEEIARQLKKKVQKYSSSTGSPQFSHSRDSEND